MISANSAIAPCAHSKLGLCGTQSVSGHESHSFSAACLPSIFLDRSEEADKALYTPRFFDRLAITRPAPALRSAAVSILDDAPGHTGAAEEVIARKTIQVRVTVRDEEIEQPAVWKFCESVFTHPGIPT